MRSVEGIKQSLEDAIESLESIQSLIEGNRTWGSRPEDYPVQYFTQGDWDCKDSPTGMCMYTGDMDSCIFCYEPDERK